ncbi:hypothetical protein Tco_0897225 [Tanacetum coccineum]
MHLESDSRALAYLRLSLGHSTSTRITVVVKICPGGTTMVDVSLEGGHNFPTKLNVLPVALYPLQSYTPTVVPQQPPTFQPNFRFVAPTFLLTDDPIASLNKSMIFLSFAYNSRYPPVNNQLITLSNPRTLAIIENGQVMVQNVQAQEAVVVLNDEYEYFLDDSLEENDECEDLQLQATTNFKADHVDAYDSDYDDEATTNAIFTGNMSPVGSINRDTVKPRYHSKILSEVPHYDTYHDSDMRNCNVQEMGYIENIVSNNESYDELTSNSNVVSYADYMVTMGNGEDNYVPTLHEIYKFDDCITRRTTLSPYEIDSWEQSDIKGAFKQDLIPFSENLKETFKLFEKSLINEVKEMKDILKQMEDEVDQCSIEKKCFEIEKKQLLINNDRLLEENISYDIMCTYLHSLNEVDNCGKCKSLDIMLLDLQESNKSLCEMKKCFANLEEYNISLDIAFQNHKEKMINDSRTNNNNHLVKAIDNQSFEINELKVE